ncbi:MAG TPA: YiiX/YebB-like N1pC/P60 family cysteine hydrolase [Xanthobacteraceae bacterium]|nr:YiiX/YebB-like N1pC/P60 family cysteine hydrolase [Xanthobacteraceae bacterium]
MTDLTHSWISRQLIKYLEQTSPGIEPFTPSDPASLEAVLQPGDVLLVEGNTRVSGIIKYLTQSTWSHAALYVGPRFNKRAANGSPHVLIEANLGQGVVTAPLSKYTAFHTRVCRPVGLHEDEREQVVAYMIKRLGIEYDVKNIIDLMRYLVPAPIPARFRRRLLSLGSGVPTKVICSGLIAQAFESVSYPILPRIELVESKEKRREILHIRHHSLYMPRDFDISPYFRVVKPTIELGFDYHSLRWANRPMPPEDERENMPRPLAEGGSPPVAPELPEPVPAAASIAA